MKPVVTIFLAIVLSVAATLVTVKMMAQKSAAPIAKESTYARVMRTGTIKCGYLPINAVIHKDANTGQLSGVGFDLVNQMAKNLGLKVDWVGEAGFLSMSEDLNKGRFDMICTPLMPSGTRAKAMSFSRPLFMMPALLWLHKDNKHTGDDLSWANDPAVKFAFVDGIVFDIIGRRHFPRATIVNLPELTAATDQLMEVASKKADATIILAYDGVAFAKANHDVIKPASLQPVANILYAFGLPQGDHSFKTMVDIALDELMTNGNLDQILNAHDTHPASYVHLKPIY